MPVTREEFYRALSGWPIFARRPERDTAEPGDVHRFLAELSVRLREIYAEDIVGRLRAETGARWDHIAKPLRGLGQLEDHVAQIVLLNRLAENDRQSPPVKEHDMAKSQILPAALVVFCSDNGIVAEGVSQTDQSVTARVAMQMASQKSCSGIMARQGGIDYFPLDAGMVTPGILPGPGIIRGTRSFLQERAMTRGEAMELIGYGFRCGEILGQADYGLILGGEMGIGNTTTAAAVISALTGQDPDRCAGRGAGLSDEGLLRKRRVIKTALTSFYAGQENQDPLTGTIDVLSAVGGGDIAALTGLYLGAAKYRIPVVLDGLISLAAALAAVSICTASGEVFLASHLSQESGAGLALEALQKMVPDNPALRPVIYGGLRLGEGSGALLMVPLLRQAMSVYRDMMVFEEMGVKQYVNQEDAGC